MRFGRLPWWWASLTVAAVILWTTALIVPLLRAQTTTGGRHGRHQDAQSGQQSNDPNSPDNNGPEVDPAAARAEAVLKRETDDDRQNLQDLLTDLEPGIDPPPLCRLAAKGPVGDLDSMLDGTVDVNLRDLKNGWTALHYAAYYGNLQTAKLLLDRDALIDVQTPHAGLTPLVIAVAGRHKEMVQFLIDHHANVNGGGGHESPLHQAARMGEWDLALLLLKDHANPNITDQRGFTPMFVAKTAQIVELLAACGANVNAQNEKGFTPLLVAATALDVEKVKALLSNDADVNTASRDRLTTPLSVLAKPRATPGKGNADPNSVTKTIKVTCPTCGGSGQVQTVAANNNRRWNSTPSQGNASNYQQQNQPRVETTVCPTCHGTGYVQKVVVDDAKLTRRELELAVAATGEETSPKLATKTAGIIAGMLIEFGAKGDSPVTATDFSADDREKMVQQYRAAPIAIPTQSAEADSDQSKDASSTAPSQSSNWLKFRP